MSNALADTSGPRPILALVYTDGIATDRFIANLGYQLRSQGLRVAGIVQRNEFVRNRAKCDMEIEELASETILRISEDRGALARGCRLNRAALSEAECLLMRALERRPDIVIINKFGREEAEGSGLRETIAKIVGSGVPIVIGVPSRNIDQWRAFSGDLAVERIADRGPVAAWLKSQGICSHWRERALSESHQSY